MRPALAAALRVAVTPCRSAWENWRGFWFKPADPTPLGVMRILFGAMLLYTHIVWGLNLRGFFGADGWQPESLVRSVQNSSFAWSFWWWIPDGLHPAAHILSLVILALFMLGALTPVTSVLAYLITISYAMRAPMANYGLDQINGFAALYLAIGPSGRALSLDRLWERYKAARLGIDTPPIEPSARANLALRLIQVHVCVIYVFACLSKLQGESWWNGQAIWQAVANLEYQSRDLTWLAWYPWLVNLLTHATIIFEMTFWALVWRPFFRPIMLLAGVAIHLGIGAFMGMWTFGLAMIFTYVAFIPSEVFQGLLSTAGNVLQRAVQLTRFDASRVQGLRAKALCAALHLDGTNTPVVDSFDQASEDMPVEPAVPPAITAEVPKVASDGANGRRHTPAETVAAAGLRVPSRPVLVVVESRLKRQADIQEYFIGRGFRCLIASDLHEARSLISSIDVAAIAVTSTWAETDEIADFRDSLISGGPSLPVSVFLLKPSERVLAPRFEDRPRHRVSYDSVSLRELRLLVLELLGLPERDFRKARAVDSAQPGAHPTQPGTNGSAGSNGSHRALEQTPDKQSQIGTHS
jgi:hypothetical protein